MNKEQDILYMRNMLSRCYPEEGISKVPKSGLDYTLRFYSWDEIVHILETWEKLGVLTIVKDPRLAFDQDIYVIFQTFFDGTVFPPHWIRD